MKGWGRVAFRSYCPVRRQGEKDIFRGGKGREGGEA